MSALSNITSNHAAAEFEITIKDAKRVISAKNHFELIRQLIAQSDHVLFVSPFIYKDFINFFSDLPIENVRIELVTSLPFCGAEQFTKPSSLLNFGTIVEERTGIWPDIGIDDSLHAKIYIFSRENKSFAAILTSANFTHSGLTLNHETGILINDAVQLESLNLDARRNLSFIKLNEYQIKKLCDVANYISNMLAPIQDDPRDYDIGLQNALNMYCTPSGNKQGVIFKNGARVYVKVSGTKDDPILPNQRISFNEERREIWFSNSPNKIKIGDCIIEVAVGGMCFLGYYSCASEVFERTSAERNSDKDFDRWPFYVLGNNLSLKYSEKWFNAPLMYDEITEKFVNLYPSDFVTVAESKSFKGALSFGSSYIEVTKEYGEFVRQRIDTWPHTD
jgi:hypothetical protein